MILQTGPISPRTPIGNMIAFFTRIANPNAAKADDLLTKAARDPAFGQAFADSARTEQFNMRESLKSEQALAQQFGDQRPQKGPDQILGLQVETPQDTITTATTRGGRGGRQTQTTEDRGFNPLAGLAASVGLDPDAPETSDAIFALMSRFPATLAGTEEDIQLREGGARRNVDVDIAQDTKAIAESKRDTVSADLQREVLKGFDARGGVFLQIEEQIGTARAGIASAALVKTEAEAGVKLLDQHVPAYMRMFASQSPQVQELLSLAVQNPTYFASLEKAKDRSLRANLAALSARVVDSKTAVQHLSAVMGLFDEESKLLNNLEQAKGTKENPGSPDIINGQGAIYNDWQRAMQANPIAAQIMTPMIFSAETGEVTTIAPPQARPAGARLLGEEGDQSTERDPREIVDAEAEAEIQGQIALAQNAARHLATTGLSLGEIVADFAVPIPGRQDGASIRDLMLQRATFGSFIQELGLIIGGDPQEEILREENRRKAAAVVESLPSIFTPRGPGGRQ